MISTIAPEPVLTLETPESVQEAVPAAIPKIRKPRIWTAFAALFFAVILGQLASIAAVIAVGVGTGIIMGAQGANGAQIETRIQEIYQQPVLALLLLLIPNQLGMAAGLLIAVRRSKQPIKQQLGILPQTGRVIGGFKLARMAAFAFAASLVCIILSYIVLPVPVTRNAVGAAIDDGSWTVVTLLSLLLSLLPAVVEESLIRGYLQRRLLQRWSPAVAISISTLLFASLHFDSVHHIFAVVPLGLITGLLAYRTNSIKPGMVVHALYNATVVAYAALGKVMPNNSTDANALVALGAMSVLGLIGLPAIVSLLRRPKPLTSIEPQASLEKAVEFSSVSVRMPELPRRMTDSVLASSAV